MNNNVKKLYEIAQKSTRYIIGLMSGTSLDGLDIALCRIQGSGADTQAEVSAFKTVAYTSDFKDEIRQVFAKKDIDFQHLTLLNAWIGRQHASMILDCLKEWGIRTEEVDLIASHGQTVFHTPKILHKLEKYPNATLQIGDGDHIAVQTGIITISDFRQKHIAAGGEGAPLAMYGDYFVFSKAGENRIMLNMGGIANFTFLPASLDAEKVLVTDTGTGNTLIDAFTRHYFPEKAYDENAELASQGTVIPALLQELKNNDFFHKPLPKTTGPELFNIEYVNNAIRCGKLEPYPSVYDLLATLTYFSAETIVDTIKTLFDDLGLSDTDISKVKVYTSGGGAHNPLLMKWIKELLPTPQYLSTSELNISPDAKEAVLFAILANECIAGNGVSFGNREGVPSVTMGKISFPD